MSEPRKVALSNTRASRRLTKIFAISIAFVLGLAAAMVGLFLFRLLLGPMDVSEAARFAEGILSDVHGGVPAKIDRAEVRWEGGLAIELGGISIGHADAGFSIRIPTARIALQTLPLLIGSVKPASLDLDSPVIFIDTAVLETRRRAQERQSEAVATLRQDQQNTGAAALADTSQPTESVAEPESSMPGGASPKPAPTTIAQLSALARTMSSGIRLIERSGIRTINARNGSVEVIRPDEGNGVRRIRLRDVDATTIFGIGGGTADSMISAQGEVGRWTMRSRYATAPDGTRNIVLTADDVTLRDVAGLDDPKLRVGMPLYPSISFIYDAKDLVTGARLDLRVGAGPFRFGREPEEELLIDEGRISVSWDPALERFNLETASFSVGPSTLGVKGTIQPPVAGGAEVWSIDLQADGGSLNPRDVPGAPVAVEGFKFIGRYDVPRRLFSIDDFHLTVTGAQLRSVGYLDFADPQLPLIANTVFSPADTAIIKRVWPHFMAFDARRWFLENVEEGRITDVLAKIQIPLRLDPAEWPGNAVSLKGRFDGATARTLGELPRVTGVEGNFAMDNKRFEATVEKGVIATRAPRRPTIGMFRFALPNAFVKHSRSAMDLRISGEAAGIAEILNSEPLRVLDAANVKADGLTGIADIRGRIDVTFERDMPPNDLDYRFEATLDKFASPNPILGRKFQDANLKVNADTKGYTVTGKARIDGVVADVNVFQPSDGSNAPERRDFALTLDDAARQRLGLDMAGLVTGTMKLEVAQPGSNDQQKRMVADLTGARLVIPQFGWTKGAGVPAKASLDLTEDEKGARIDNLTVESEGLQIKGAITVDKDKRLATADIQRFALRKGDESKFKLQRGTDQVLTANWEASSFDIRGLLQSIKMANKLPEVDPKKQSDFNIKARAARLIGFNDVVLTDVLIEAQTRSQSVTSLKLTGRVPGGRSIDLAIKTDSSGRRILTVQSDDAGATLAFLDLYDRIRGGSLQLSAVLGGQGDADGEVRIVGFKLESQARGDRVATLETNADGVRQVAVKSAPISEGAMFDRFSVRFALRKGAITLTDGIAKGPGTGATMNGQIDLNNQRLQVAGTFIPLYGLNNLVSRIPIFGEIAGAGRNEGLVGVTFRVIGPVDDPVLQFNPISAIAPGIFRRIFEYKVDDASEPLSYGPRN
jgi:hypothetical protein